MHATFGKSRPSMSVQKILMTFELWHMNWKAILAPLAPLKEVHNLMM